MTEILPTNNESFGFWGTMETALEAEGEYINEVWAVVSELVMAKLKLTPEQTRDLLDAKFGRHFADALVDEFFSDGAIYQDESTEEWIVDDSFDNQEIVRAATDILSDPQRQRWIADAVQAVGGQYARPASDPLLKIAREYLGVKTFEVGDLDSQDFKAIHVDALRRALAAAYKLGKESR